jgi:hypothetical protein
MNKPNSRSHDINPNIWDNPMKDISVSTTMPKENE